MKLPHIQHFPVWLLIAINLVIGLQVYRHYGMTIDEPYFYGYADAVGYAYSPREWFSGHFDLNQAYGPSAADHANRGPAYLLLARAPAHLLQAAGLDQGSAWHLINFLFYQIGIYFFYVLCRRWMGAWPAFAATALFTAQPVLWEHAFINPKDPPFLVFFLLSLEFGFRMAEQLAALPDDAPLLHILRPTILPAILLGLTTNVRIIGPLAGVLVLLYFFLLQPKPQRLLWLLPYGLIAILTLFVTWPYLWPDPLRRFYEVLTLMSHNPTELRVLFAGQLYRANDLPRRYLPVLLLFNLTEPVWPLAFLGSFVALLRFARQHLAWKSLLPTLGWFAIPFVYVLLLRPPMYDGFRHFLFIVPPVFLLGGLAVEWLFNWLRPAWLRLAVLAALLFPGIHAAIQLHPYEYIYYNRFAGGTRQATLYYESDYWLTCYKEAIENFNRRVKKPTTLYVRRDGFLAKLYAAPHLTIVDIAQSDETPPPWTFELRNARANSDLQKLRQQGAFLTIQRQGVILCAIERIVP
jgi:hypothetical protein